MTKKLYIAVFATILAAGVLLTQSRTGDAQITTKPAAENPKDVPLEVVKKMDSVVNARIKPVSSRAEWVQQVAPRMKKVLKIGGEAESGYPEASNLHDVRTRMLRAAHFMTTNVDDSYMAQVVNISRRILASKIETEKKLQADFFVTKNKIASAMPTTIIKEIRAFIKRYEKTKVAPYANIYGAILAKDKKLVKLLKKILNTLEQKYLDDPDAHSFLRQHGRHPDVGKPFETELIKLDGTKITLPKKFKGKVVVIDFWASWCEPCRDLMPHMKQLYAKYNPQGVVFIGISLDRSREALDVYLKGAKLPWIQTYASKPQDPTARKYGVNGIPNVWVIGTDGKVVSDNARGQLEAIIQKAMTKAPANN